MSFLVSMLLKKPANDAGNHAPAKVLSDSSYLSANAIMHSFFLIEDYDPKFLTAQRIVTQLTPLIEKNITTEGLYRISASAVPLKIFFETLKSDPKTVVPDSIDAHTLAGVLKLALRELDPKLLQCQFDALLEASRMLASAKSLTYEHDFQEAMLSVNLIIQEAFEPLPAEKAACVKTLFTHLHQISLSAEANKMSARNLSTVFTPNLVDCGVENLGHFLALFAYLIEHPEVLKR